MKLMRFRVHIWLAVLAAVLTVSCQSPRQGANRVGFLLPNFQGLFGDGKPVWTGQFYTSNNLFIAAHLPTRSEFFIMVRHNTNGNEHLNEELINRSKEAAQATKSEEQAITISQKLCEHRKEFRRNIAYTRCEFVGKRPDSDRYDKSEAADVIVYSACLTPDRPAKEALYSCAMLVMPANIPQDHRSELLSILENFLTNGVTYYLE